MENPTVLDSVGYNLRIPNLSENHLEVKKNSHLQIRRMKPVSRDDLERKHEYPKKPNLQIDIDIGDISIDPSKKLITSQQVKEIRKVMEEVKIVFSYDDSTYKGEYKASFEFSSETNEQSPRDMAQERWETELQEAILAIEDYIPATYVIFSLKDHESLRNIKGSFMRV